MTVIARCNEERWSPGPVVHFCLQPALTPRKEMMGDGDVPQAKAAGWLTLCSFWNDFRPYLKSH